MTLAHDTSAELARRTVEGALQAWHLSGHVSDVLLVVTELVQNVTQHTAGGGQLRLLLQTTSILIEVTDTDPTLPRIPEPDLRRIGGRGLLIVAAVALTWGSRNTSWAGKPGKIVWAEVAYHRGAQTPQSVN